MLFGIAVVLIGAGLTGAALFRRRAPAVSLGLIGGLAGGLWGFFVGVQHDPTSVPADVAAWSTGALVAFGLVGLLLTPRGPARTLRRIAAWMAGLAPLAVAALAVVLLYACPLYVTEDAGYCFHEVDVLGGWISFVTLLFLVDAAVVVIVLLVSAKEVGARDDPPLRSG
jgi:hypothetical protein